MKTLHYLLLTFLIQFSVFAQSNEITLGNYTNDNVSQKIIFSGFRDVVSNYLGASIEAQPVWQCCYGYPSVGYAGVKHFNLLFNLHKYGDWNANAVTTAMFINGNNANIGIGTLNPDEKLTVNGTIHAREVKIELDIPADYVFQSYFLGNSILKPSYNFPPLEEVATYIEENHHLPDIPSAEELKADGLELGVMNNLLLQKIEELTLYIIQLNERIEELETLTKNGNK